MSYFGCQSLHPIISVLLFHHLFVQTQSNEEYYSTSSFIHVVENRYSAGSYDLFCYSLGIHFMVNQSATLRVMPSFLIVNI